MPLFKSPWRRKPGKPRKKRPGRSELNQGLYLKAQHLRIPTRQRDRMFWELHRSGVPFDALLRAEEEHLVRSKGLAKPDAVKGAKRNLKEWGLKE